MVIVFELMNDLLPIGRQDFPVLAIKTLTDLRQILLV